MGARTTDDPRRAAGRPRSRRPRLHAFVLCAALLAAGMGARAHDGEAALGAALGLGLAGALATTVGLGSVALARLRRALRRTRARLRHEIRARRAVEAAVREAREGPPAAGSRRALERAALYDPLTELPNRASFLDHLARRLSACLRSGQGLAVAMLDLDGFKEVNDTLGHHHGDRLLQAVAARLRRSVRASDLVARWSGDEFVLLLADAGDEDAARAATGKVLDALARPLEVEGQPIYIQASAGIALAPEDGTEPDTLIRRADAAMYRAKERRSGIERYVPEEDPYSRQRLELAAELAGDLRSGAARLAVWYQPQVALATARVVAAEALLRWSRADGTPVRPDRAVVVAERAGLIRPLTFRVLELAFTHLTGWHARGLALELAVNLSPWMLNDPNLARDVLRRLEDAGLAPGTLTLEITEGALLREPRIAVRLLGELREAGVRIALDDFGTGYSSLDRLWRLPVDEIKIDRRFVINIGELRNLAIVRTIVTLGRELGVTLTAEGVENADTAELLAGLGVDRIQGYHVARPMPPDELPRWVRSTAAEPR